MCVTAVGLVPSVITLCLDSDPLLSSSPVGVLYGVCPIMIAFFSPYRTSTGVGSVL